MKKINIAFAVGAVLMIASIVLSIIKKDWLDVFTSCVWLIALTESACFFNKANNLYEAAQYFIEKQEETEENYEG